MPHKAAVSLDERACADAPVRRWSVKAPISTSQHPHSKAVGYKRMEFQPHLVKAAYPSPRHGAKDLPPCELLTTEVTRMRRLIFKSGQHRRWLEYTWGCMTHVERAIGMQSRSEMRLSHPYSLRPVFSWGHLRHPIAAISLSPASSIGTPACSHAAGHVVWVGSSIIAHTHPRSIQSQPTTAASCYGDYSCMTEVA